jgi:hypothetical protein
MSEKDVQPVAWSVFDKRTQKHWYTNESVNTAGYYAKEYSHREPDGSPSMLVVPLYERPHPPTAEADELRDALQKTVAHIEAMMAHIEHKPVRFQEHCWQTAVNARKVLEKWKESK